MQRFGRIDRLGSRNRQIAMTNFWPTADLDRYLDLKNRVEARMVLADATATGLDDPLSQETPTEDEYRETARMELSFRDRQLTRMREEILDIEEADDGIGLNDLTLDDFLADLLHYIQQNRKVLEAAPAGYPCDRGRRRFGRIGAHARSGGGPGVIFCLKYNGDPEARNPETVLWPYFLVYVRKGRRGALHLPASPAVPGSVPGTLRRPAESGKWRWRNAL